MSQGQARKISQECRPGNILALCFESLAETTIMHSLCTGVGDLPRFRLLLSFQITSFGYMKVERYVIVTHHT